MKHGRIPTWPLRLDHYPKTIVVWRGAILGTIVNATMCADRPSYATLEAWDGSNYLVDGWDGRYGAITFGQDCLVGTFYDAKSDRTPFRCEGKYDYKIFLRGMSARHLALAENGALKYWHME